MIHGNINAPGRCGGVGLLFLVGRRRSGGGEVKEAFRRAAGAAAVGTEEVRRPSQSPLPGLGAPRACPGAYWGGKGAAPGGGARRGLGQPKGLGAPSTGKVFASSYYWEGRGGAALPQGRQDGAEVEGCAVCRQAPAEGAGRRSHISVAKLAISMLSNLVARHALLS